MSQPDIHLYTAATMNGYKPVIFLEEAGKIGQFKFSFAIGQKVCHIRNELIIVGKRILRRYQKSQVEYPQHVPIFTCGNGMHGAFLAQKG